MSSNRIDLAGLRRSMSVYRRAFRVDAETVVKHAAKGFVKEAMNFTPPAGSGVTGAAAKKRGVANVVSDIEKIMVRSNRPGRDPREVHKELRTRGGGTRKVKSKVRVKRAAMNAFLRQQVAKVGRLSSGWLKAAAFTGARVPAWVRRHPDTEGRVKEHKGNRYKIEFENAVSYVNWVPGYGRTIASAVRIQAAKMQRAAEGVARRRSRRA